MSRWIDRLLVSALACVWVALVAAIVTGTGRVLADWPWRIMQIACLPPTLLAAVCLVAAVPLLIAATP